MLTMRQVLTLVAAGAVLGLFAPVSRAEDKKAEDKTTQPPGRGGPGAGRFGPGTGGRTMGGRGLENAINDALGVETPIKLDRLSYGPAQRLVEKVPVGGVDGLQDVGGGFRFGGGAAAGTTGAWKVEDIFTLTEEQTKALAGLREQYKTEMEQQQKAFEEANKALAAQIITLRQKYEQLANDVLTGAPKEEKLKLDALAQDFAQQRLKKAQEQKPQADQLRAEFEKALAAARQAGNYDALRDLGAKAGELTKAISDQREALQKDTIAKMKAAVTGDARRKLDEAIQKLEQLRDAQPRFGPGGPGGGGARGPRAPAAKPAPAPDGTF